MEAEGTKDLLKMWTGSKTVGVTGAATESTSTPVAKKQLPKKLRQIPESHFMPRLSRPKSIAICGSCIAAGIGAAILGAIWTQKKIKG